MRCFPGRPARMLALMLVLMAAAAVAIFPRPSPAQAPARPVEDHQRIIGDGEGSAFRGAGSCSAVACHGSIAPLRGSSVFRNEHTTWVSDDPHARAYQTLFTERSFRIARNLAGPGGRFVPAHEDRACLACHTTPRTDADLAATAALHQDGVGCEACHGASGRWLEEHTSLSWNARGAAGKEQLGFRELKNLPRRAENCAGCHVGRHAREGLAGSEPTRDVNHDLIAAGHPRLMFELSAHLDNLPAHWVEKNENRDADFPARVWTVGQVATARASLELLADRSGDPRSPWPEFSEYGCYSCHHDLADQAWRKDVKGLVLGEKIPPGAPRFGSWSLPMSIDLAGLSPRKAGPDEWKSFREALQRLSGEMSRPLPDRPAAAGSAREASSALEGRLADLSNRRLDGMAVEAMIRGLNAPEAWAGVESWDEAAQRYLALVPLAQAWGALVPAGQTARRSLRDDLESIRRKLQFPRGYDSPRGIDPVQLRTTR